jgi:transcriptional regulator with XRE-family HTH domain
MKKILLKKNTVTLKDLLIYCRTRIGYNMSEVSRLSRIEELADHRNYITEGYISRLEAGKEINPSLLKLLTLCKIYKISPSRFFSFLEG